jgi:hypothetical protein
MSRSYNVTLAGSGISFASGACLALGLNLLGLYYNFVIKNKEPTLEHIKKLSAITFVGGGMTSFGLFFLVPNSVRNLWY